MKKIIAIILLAGIARSQNLDYSHKIMAEIQTASPESLEDIEWQQGSTPLIRVDVLSRGRPVPADTNMVVRMIIGHTATNDYYAVVTNSITTNNSYYIQWPTIGTNTGGAAWWYTIYYEESGRRYWTGNGKLYIEETTSTDPDGLVWQEFTTGVSSFAGRSGAIVPQADDYSSFYLEEGDAGTSTNLSEYNNDAGYITEQVAAPVNSVFGRTNHVVAVSTDYEEFYSPIGHVHAISEVTGLQGELDGKAGTGDVVQVSSDLSYHESLTGMNVHGLGSMAVESTDDYYTSAATDALLDGKADTNTTAAIETRLSDVELWPTETWSEAYSWGNHAVAGYATGTPVYVESDPVWTSEKAGYATGTPVYAESDPIFSASVAADISAGDTQAWHEAAQATNDILDLSIRMTNNEGLSATNQADIATIKTGKLDVVTAWATYATTGTVGSIDARLKDVEAWPTETWSEAYSWGNHATAGYATGTPVYLESDPVFSASVAADINANDTQAWHKAAQDAAQATNDISGLSTRVTDVEGLSATNQADIVRIDTQKVDQADFLSVQGLAETNKTDIAALDLRVGSNEVDISIFETSKVDIVTYNAHITDWGNTNTGLQADIDRRVLTNDTRQLDFTSADIRIADSVETNNPVTLAQQTSLQNEIIDLLEGVGAGATNIALAVGVGATNYSDSVGYAVGAGATNLAYAIGAGATNLAYAVGLGGTNFTLDVAAGISNDMFRADGTTPMSGNINAGGNAITNAGAIHMPVMDTMTYTGAVPFLAWNPSSGNFEQVPNATMETYSRTINVATNESIQDAIDSIGKYIPYGVTVTVLLADGTHTITNTIDIQGFYGGGGLRLQSTSTETVTNTAQNATIDGSGSAINLVRIIDSNYVRVQNIHFIVNGSGTYSAIEMQGNITEVNLLYNFAEATGGTSAIGWNPVNGSYIYSRANVINNMDRAIFIGWGARGWSYLDTGSGNNKGYWCSASLLHLRTTGVGSTQNADGGLILTSGGATLP